MSCCLIMQNKNSIIIGADSASSYLCNNKLVRLNNTAKKLFIFGNEVMFCSGKKNVVNHIIDMIEIDGDSINKSSLQKALQDLNLPNDTNLFDIEIIICGVKNNKSYICQLSQYKNFQISYNYIDSDNIEVFAAGFKSNKCLDIAKSEFNLCNGIIEDIYINTFNKMVCDEIGGYLNTFYINNNHIKVIHKDIKLDDIILENQILQTDNRIHYVIADMLVGDLLCGNKLKIIGGKDETTGNATVVIDGNGITLDGGAITWKTPVDSSAVSGLNDFKNAVKGTLGVTNITSTSVISPKIGGGYLYIKKNGGCSVEIDPLGLNNKNVFRIANKNNANIMTIDSNGNGTFTGTVYASAGSFSGTIDCGNGNFIVDSNGSIQSKGGINISNDIVAWNGTSCFKNSDNEFLIQQGSSGNPVVRFKIDENETYTIGNTVSIYGGNVEIGYSDEIGKLYSQLQINKDGIISSGINLNVATTDALRGYSAHKDQLFYIAGVTYYADGGHTVDLGEPLIGTNIRGAVVWLKTNAAYVNDAIIQTSDRRAKKDFTSLYNYEDFYMDLNPLGYKMVNGSSGRTHLGFVAQEVEESLLNNGLTSQDFAGFVKYNDDPESEFEENYALRYNEFIALNTHMIQKLYRKIEELEKKLESK